MTLILQIPLLALAIGVLAGCTNETPSVTYLDKSQNVGIINGTQANADNAISRSTVIINLPSGKFCSGVLLNDHVVLTAAHCVNRLTENPALTVLVPETKKSCFSASVSEISLAPIAAPGNKFPPDLALLKLNRSICNTALVALAPIVDVGDLLKAAGFGYGAHGGFPDFLTMRTVSSEKNGLRALYLNEFPNDADVLSDWQYLEENYEEFAEMYLFALTSSSEQSLCHGDSGGPVYQEHDGVLTIYGVNGGGFPHSKKGVPACQNTYLQFFAPLGPSIDWIQSTLKSW